MTVIPIAHYATSIALMKVSHIQPILSPLKVQNRLLDVPKGDLKRKHKAPFSCPLTSVTARSVSHNPGERCPTDGYGHLCRKWLVVSLSADLQLEASP